MQIDKYFSERNPKVSGAFISTARPVCPRAKQNSAIIIAHTNTQPPLQTFERTPSWLRAVSTPHTKSLWKRKIYCWYYGCEEFETTCPWTGIFLLVSGTYFVPYWIPGLGLSVSRITVPSRSFWMAKEWDNLRYMYSMLWGSITLYRSCVLAITSIGTSSLVMS